MSTIPKSKRDESSWLTPTQTKEELLVADLQSAASKVHHEQQHFITSGGNNTVGNVLTHRTTSTSDIEKERLEMQLSQAIDSAVHLREANKELARTVLVSEQNIAAMDTEIKQLKAEGQEYKTQLNKIRLSSSSSSSSSSLLASPGKNIAVNYTAQAARTQQVLAQTQSLVFSLRSTFQSASTQLKSWQRSELENIAKLKRAIPSLRVSTSQLPSSPFLSTTGVLRSPESSPLARSQHTDKSMSRSDVESNASGNVGSNDNGDAEVSFADPDTTFSADDAKLVPLMRMQADLKGRLVAALAEAADERLRSQQLSIRIIELEESLEKAATPSIAQNALLVETLEKLAEAQSASGVALAAAAASKSALMSAEIQLRASKAELAAVLDEVQLMKEESEQQYMMSNSSSGGGGGGGGGEGRIINNSLSIDSITGLDISQTSYQSDNYTNNKAVADATAIAVQKAAEGAAAAASAAYSHSLSEIRASYESRLFTYRAEADSTKEVVASELASLHAAYLSASKDRDNASASLSACVAAFENERVALMRKIEELEENMHHSNLPPPLTTTVEEGNRTLETHHPIEPSATVETPLSSPKSSSDTDTSASSSSSSSSSHSHSKSLVRRPTMRVIERSPATTIVSFVPADPAISASSDAAAATTTSTTAAEASSSSSTTSNTSSSSSSSSSNSTSSSSSSSSSNVSSPAVVLKSTYSSNSLARSGSFFALNPTTGQIHTPSSSIRESERERQESVIAQLTAELTQMRAEASDRELRWQQVALSHSLKWQGQLLDSQKRLEFVEREKEKLLFEMNENEQVRMSQLQASRASAVQARRALDAAVKAASVKEATLENAKRRLISEQQTLVTALREDAMTAKKIFEAEIVTLRGIVTAKDKAIETLKLELLPQKRRVFAEEEIKAQLREAQLVAAQLVERQGQLKSEKEAAEAVASAALQSSKQESHNVAARLSASIPFHVNAITKDIQKEADKLHEDLEEVRTLLRTVTLERDEAIERLKSKEEAANKAVKIAATLQRLADSTNVYGKTTSPRKNRAKNDINQETDDSNVVDGSTRGRSRSVATVAGTVVDPLSNATLFAAGALSPASIKKRILSRTSKEALLQSGMTLSHRATSSSTSSSTLTPHIDSLGGPSPALPAVIPIHTMSATQMLLSPRTSITKQQQQQQEKEITRKTPQSQHSLSSSSSNGTSGDSLLSPRSSSTVRFKSASPPGQHETRRLRSASPNPSSLNHPVDPKFIVAVKGRRGRVALRLGVAALFMYSVLKREKLRNAFNTLRIHDLQQKSNNLAIIMKELVSIFGLEVVQSMPPATLIKTRYIALAQTAHDLSIAAQNALADATLLGKKAESLTQTTQELTIKLQNERESLAASNEDARKLHKALGETEAMRLELEVQVTPLKAQVQKLHVAEAERNKAIERLKSIESSSESLRSDIINLRAANSRLSIERGFLASISDLLESCSKDPANATTSSLNTIKTDAFSSDLILLKENALSIATVIKSKTNTVKTLESELHSTSNALTGSQRHREASEVHAARARASLDTAESEIKELKDKLVLALKGREEIEKGRSGLITTAREHEEKEEKLLDDLKKEKERSLKLQSELEHSIKRATDLATSKASIESENVRLKGTLASALAANNSTLSSHSTSSMEPQNSVVSGITPRRSAPPPPSK
jgi:hypothetical protein